MSLIINNFSDDNSIYLKHVSLKVYTFPLLLMVLGNLNGILY